MNSGVVSSLTQRPTISKPASKPPPNCVPQLDHLNQEEFTNLSYVVRVFEVSISLKPKKYLAL
jgi:hypothetical protein